MPLPDGEDQEHQADQSRAEDEIILREDAERDRDEHEQDTDDTHPAAAVVNAQSQVQERQHPEGERSVHAQINGRGDAGDAERVAAHTDEGIEIVPRDALSDAVEQQQRARHHDDVDRKRQPAAEHAREERADRMHQRVVERRVRSVDHLIVIDVFIVETVLARGEVFGKILGRIPFAVHAELLGRVGEVIGEQFVLVITLLHRHKDKTERKADDDDHRQPDARGFFSELHGRYLLMIL